jgi:hypothetical protein
LPRPPYRRFQSNRQETSKVSDSGSGKDGSGSRRIVILATFASAAIFLALLSAALQLAAVFLVDPGSGLSTIISGTGGALMSLSTVVMLVGQAVALKFGWDSL